MSLCPALRHRLRSLWHQSFGTIALMEFVLKIRTSSSVLLVSLRANEAMHVPWPRVWKLWQVLGAQFFGTIVLMKFVSWKTRANSSAFLVSLPANETMHVPSPNDCKPLEKSWAQFFGTMALSWKPELSPSYFPRFPLRPPCRRFRLAPSPRKLSPSYFPRFPFPPPCHRFHLAPGPSQRSSPQAISHGFPSVHPVVASISLLPHGALPKLFPTVSLPSTLSSLPSRSWSFTTELSPAISHGFPPSTLSSLPSRSFPTELSPSYFPWLAFRPPSGRFRIAPSQRSSPQATSHGFPSVHPLITSVSLPRGKCN